MKKTTLIIIFIPIIAIIAILLIALFSFMIFKIYENAKKGEDAIKVMTPEEIDFLNTKLKTINQDTDINTLINLLGEPYRYYPKINKQSKIRWILSYDKEITAVEVYYENNKITKVEYTVIPRFEYEINLK
ncbi:hypothetical protein GOV12_04660 [Candidatus Pacearchaeota archaeon]|nr:hypothetical protein [Candidatus Pacearchaeota archaeon]